MEPSPQPPLHTCMTKALVGDAVPTGASVLWAGSRRGYLEVFSDRLECGDWVIPYDEVKEIVLCHGTGFLIPGYILRVHAEDRTYHFGLNPGWFWMGELPFPVRHERRGIGRTLVVYSVRLVVVVLLVYLLWLRGWTWNGGLNEATLNQGRVVRGSGSSDAIPHTD